MTVEFNERMGCKTVGIQDWDENIDHHQYWPPNRKPVTSSSSNIDTLALNLEGSPIPLIHCVTD